MQSLRQIKTRIRSIENTKKVTSAMEMVSVAKLNRIDKTLYALRPYILELEGMLNNLINSNFSAKNTLLEERPVKEKVCLCLVTADSGLCAGYNNNIIRLGEEFIAKYGRNRIKLVLVGKKGFNYFRRQKDLEILNSYIGLNGRYNEKTADEITDFLVNIFLSHKADEVYIAYSHFKNALVHMPKIMKFLNIKKSPGGENKEYIFEPDGKIILNELIPRYISVRLRLILLESFTSEHAARTVAMKSATDNAKELLQALSLLKNKVRQANITQDIMEIVSASEALKG